MSNHDTPKERSIELEIEVEGTPEEVWEAIATGPGISSWYVPHVVEERADGAAMASFGEGQEMQIPGRVVAWEPPTRVVFDGGEGVPGLAFEWLVEARDGGTCVVRLVNSGFVAGTPWDDQYDDMTNGWRLFLTNLQLHRKYFPGQHATSMLPMAMWNGTKVDTWRRLAKLLGIEPHPEPGTHITVNANGAPPLAGTVVSGEDWRLALVLDSPCPGTAMIAVEGGGDTVGVSIWSYLYGPERDAVVERDAPLWRSWLEGNAGPA